MMRKKVNENEMMWTKTPNEQQIFFVWLANLPLKAVIKIYAHKKTETEVMVVAILSVYYIVGIVVIIPKKEFPLNFRVISIE